VRPNHRLILTCSPYYEHIDATLNQYEDSHANIYIDDIYHQDPELVDLYPDLFAYLFMDDSENISLDADSLSHDDSNTSITEEELTENDTTQSYDKPKVNAIFDNCAFISETNIPHDSPSHHPQPTLYRRKSPPSI